MKKPAVILTVGASGSGKTTWAKQFIADNPNFMNLNRDDLRENYLDTRGTYKYSKAKENLVTNLQIAIAIEAIDSGKGVVISDTNLNAKTRRKWEHLALTKGLPVEYETFEEPVHVLLARNLKRSDSRPVDVVIRMAKQMREYLDKPMYDHTQPKDNSGTWRGVKQHAIVLDMDGTLADNNHRGPYEFEKAIDDKPNHYLIDLVRLHKKDGFAIIILTGRESDPTGRSEVTINWLKKYEVPFDHIWCRGYKDHRTDAIIKEELFFKHIADDFSVKCVYDDREQVVKMWRNIGVTCYQVAEGNF